MLWEHLGQVRDIQERLVVEELTLAQGFRFRTDAGILSFSTEAQALCL